MIGDDHEVKARPGRAFWVVGETLVSLIIEICGSVLKYSRTAAQSLP